MRIEFIGAAHEVTGSCHFVQVGNKNFLVDCGMEQGADIYVNQDIPVKASDIDYVFVTHAHIDHSGLLPLLYKRGFKGQIFATQATTQLCEIMLRDSAHIQEFEAEWRNRKGRRAGKEEVVPLYDTADAEGALHHFFSCAYDHMVEVCDEIKVCFRDAGHLLGSACIEIWLTEAAEEGNGANCAEGSQGSGCAEGSQGAVGDGGTDGNDRTAGGQTGMVTKKLIFSGDIGNGNRALIRDPEVLSGADYVIMESTYGNRNHEVPPDYALELAQILRKTFARKGNLVIPAFSVGRTQEMLYYMRKIKTEGMLPEFQDFEVYVDSPLSVQATTVFNKSVMDCYREEDKELIAQGVNPIGFPGLKTSTTSQDSVQINFVQKPCVIISASGMCEAGRIRHHLKHNLWRSECSVLFVGYQCPGTLGFQLLNGAKEVKLFGEAVQVAAEIINLPGISGHADHDHLLNWVRNMEQKPERVFVVHGEDSVTDYFAEELQKELGLNAVAPYSGDAYDLLTNQEVLFGSRAHAEKKAKSQTPQSAKVTAVYDRLLAAGERLLAVIKRNKGGTNKDLAKFADQIIALCEKWDRQ